MNRRRLAVVAVAALAFPYAALAQDGTPAWEDRVFVNLNVGVQTASPSFGYNQATSLFDENATAVLKIPGERAATFDVGGGVRLIGNFGAGVTYSRYNKDRTADLSVTIPHPWLYGESAVAQKEIPLTRTDEAVHLQAIYRIPVSQKLQVGMYGGPSYFRCRDDLVSQFELLGRMTFPDLDWSVDFADVVQKVEKDTVWGFNGGADVTYLMTRYFGVGGTVRYSRASHETANDFSDTRRLVSDGIWGGNGTVPVTMDHGGLQLMGGVSFRLF